MIVGHKNAICKSDGSNMQNASSIHSYFWCYLSTFWFVTKRKNPNGNECHDFVLYQRWVDEVCLCLH